MELASRQFVRAVRGRRSQMSLSRRLGFRANVVAHWESGRSFPTAAIALQACRIRRTDVQGAFRRFDERTAELVEVLDDEALAAWLEKKRGQTPVGELAQRAGLSRFVVSRILHAKTRVRLPDFFRLVEATTKRLAVLVADLVDIDRAT